MAKLAVKFERSYTKDGGTPDAKTIFVYSVTGSASALEEYATIQGEYHTVDENLKKPLFFTKDALGVNGTLITNAEKGRVYADKSAMLMAKSMCEQYGGNFGEVLAKEMMAHALKQQTVATPVAAPVAAEAPVEEDGNVSDL